MLEHVNHLLLRALVASPDLAESRLFPAYLLAEWAIYLVPAILALLWMFGGSQDRRAATAAFVTAITGLFINSLFGLVWFHPRPFMEGLAHNFLNHAPDSSFPSDHATLLMALAFSFLASRPVRAPFLWAPVLILSLAVAWARIFLGAHSPLDILGAAAVAAAAAWVVRSRMGTALCLRLTTFGERLYGKSGITNPDRLFRS
jgi:undecaprenyl-diphosphatase